MALGLGLGGAAVHGGKKGMMSMKRGGVVKGKGRKVKLHKGERAKKSGRR